MTTASGGSRAGAPGPRRRQPSGYRTGAAACTARRRPARRPGAARPGPARIHSRPGRGALFLPFRLLPERACRGPCCHGGDHRRPRSRPCPGVRPRLRPARHADRVAARRRSQRRRRRADRRAAHRRAARRPVLQRERDPARRPDAGSALAAAGPRVLRRPGRAAAAGRQRVLLRDLREGLPRPGRPGPVRHRPAGRPPPAPGPAHARRPGRRRAGPGADHHELRHAAGGRHPPGAGPGPGRAADRPGPGVLDQGGVHDRDRRPAAADEDPRRPGRGHGQEHHRRAGRARTSCSAPRPCRCSAGTGCWSPGTAAATRR